MRHLLLIACCWMPIGCATDAPQELPVDEVPEKQEEIDEPPPPVTECAPGTHSCDGACVADAVNEPAAGCALGCGDACEAPENGVATCTTDGYCAVECPSPYALVNGGCVLLACEQDGYQCGDYSVAGSTVDCGSCAGAAACESNRCAVPPDRLEPNDLRSTPSVLRTINDEDNEEDIHERDLSIDTEADEDWFRFRVEDTWGLTNLTEWGNPDIFVDLLEEDGASWSGLTSEHELTVWFKCNTTNHATVIDCSGGYGIPGEQLSDPVLGLGCSANGRWVDAFIRSSCTSTDDGGIVTVRVKKRDVPRGDRYELRAWSNPW